VRHHLAHRLQHLRGDLVPYWPAIRPVFELIDHAIGESHDLVTDRSAKMGTNNYVRHFPQQ